MSSHRLLRLLPLAMVASLAFAACGDDTSDTAATEPASETTAAGAETTAAAADVHVVASTTWTGSLAKLAGATDITVIAPTTVLHPPDYDPKPSDLVAAADADIVVYAEFESFAKRLVEAAGDATVFPITLENTAASIEKEVLRLAAEMGTEDAAKANLEAFLPQIEELGADAVKSVPATAPTVVSQVFMAYWADWAGLTSAGTFGPQPMSAGDLATLMEMTPTVIFDNYHVPGGQAFEAEGTPRIELINYPGDDLDLVAVFQHNHDLIVKAMKGEVVADTNISVPKGGAHGQAHGQAHGHGDSTETTVAAHGHGDSTETTAGAHGG